MNMTEHFSLWRNRSSTIRDLRRSWRLYEDKCLLSQQELNFLRQPVTKDSIIPSPEQVKAFTALDPSQNVRELRWF